ncbi:MAG: hypothetical protein JWN52_1424 [Actinomycetia bacterium]|nr:hypothetical protein [Actinomycetes bacterium]
MNTKKQSRSDKNTEATARDLYENVRELNYATAHPPGLTLPGTVYTILGNLAAAAHALDQTLQQLHQFPEPGTRTRVQQTLVDGHPTTTRAYQHRETTENGVPPRDPLAATTPRQTGPSSTTTTASTPGPQEGLSTFHSPGGGVTPLVGS